MKGGGGSVEGSRETYMWQSTKQGTEWTAQADRPQDYRRELKLLYEHEALYLVTDSEETKLPERANLGVSLRFSVVVILKHNSSEFLPADMRNLWPAFSIRCPAALLQKLTTPYTYMLEGGRQIWYR